MPISNLALLRLVSQGISNPKNLRLDDIVAQLGAIQAQDYLAAKWALGLRSPGSRDADVERAFNEAKILRTHVLRPTWHFVAPEDIRWMLSLTGKRVKAAMASMFRQLELEDDLLKSCNEILAVALQGGKQLTRPELVSILRQAGISSGEPLRYPFILLNAELDGVICSGARHGKQHTYALLAERALEARDLPREQALGELTQRYFTTRGPATLKDFAWWSGLTVADAEEGVEMNKPYLVREIIDKKTYWRAPGTANLDHSAPTAYLLPNYDEYMVAYQDRSAFSDERIAKFLSPRDNAFLGYSVVLDGRIAAGWKRTIRKEYILIRINRYTRFTEAEEQAVEDAALRFGEFLGKPIEIEKMMDKVSGG
ncbi:MAG: winged helix DNA-binding domain-containing protein [Chloroflexi bacterium]|nr:winged helix DNA-binding domain-containing protein [Chloroflexota bacterium]